MNTFLAIFIVITSVHAYLLVGAYIAGHIVPPFFRLWTKIVATLLWPFALAGALIYAAYASSRV